MSGFISTLLIQIGIRPLNLPPPPTSQPQNVQTETQLHEPRKLSTSNCEDKEPRFVSQLGEHHGQKSNCGDAGAGSLHRSLFFTTLPKEMDARNLQLEGTQSVTHDPSGPVPNRAAVIGGPSNSTPENDATAELGIADNVGNLQASYPHEEDEENGTQIAASERTVEGPRRFMDDGSDSELPAQSLLPADDGMGVLRSKIIAIRELQLTNFDKARMVHDLMTENYNASRELPNTSGAAGISTPSSPRSLGPPTSPKALRASEINAPKPYSPNGETVPIYENLFSLTPEDLQPTFVPKAQTEILDTETCDEELDTEEQAEIYLGCVHYHRNVKLECHTCKKWYTCRFCHDEAEDHSLIRRDTEHMLCMLCGHAQPAAQDCRQCGEQTAQYYCDICKLWDNDSKKSIYHCNDCGICRIGQGLGKDFFHCQVRILVG